MREIVSEAEAPERAVQRTAFTILAAISFCHFLNDMVQSLIPAMYPMLKDNFHLDFGQIGLITLTYQLTASLLQPVVGLYTDRTADAVFAGGRHGLHARWAADACRVAPTFAVLLIAAGVGGHGSAVFHPESSRVARLASGGQHGLAQSLFQVGGNAGSALGPLLAAFIVLPRGQGSVAWFSLAALARDGGADERGRVVEEESAGQAEGRRDSPGASPFAVSRQRWRCRWRSCWR